MATKFFGGLKAGTASVSIDILLLKTTDNTPDTGKVAANLTAYYYRQGGSATTSFTLSDLGSLNSAFNSGGLKEIGDGSYRLDVPDTMQGTLADWVELTVKDGTTALYKERFALEPHGPDDVYGLVTGGVALAATQAFNNTGQTTKQPVTLATGDVTGNLPANVIQIKGTASAGAAGYVGIDWAAINAPTTAVALSGTTHSTSQVIASVSGNVGGSVGSVTSPVTVGTNNDKTGYALSVTPPTAVQVRTEMDANSAKLANLDATISSRSVYAGGAVASVTNPVTVGTITDKTGYALSATGLDAIPITNPGGVAGQTTFPKILVALYRRFFKLSTMTATQLKTYADDGTTVNTTQVVSDDGTTQTQGAAT